MWNRTGLQSLLNRVMAPSGAMCVAAQDGLWMMGSARGKRWVQTRQKPKLTRKAICKKQHAAWCSYPSTSWLQVAGERSKPRPTASEMWDANTPRLRCYLLNLQRRLGKQHLGNLVGGGLQLAQEVE